MERAADVPYDVRKLCAYLWDMHPGDGNVNLTEAEADRALAAVLRTSHANHLTLYLTLTITQRRGPRGQGAAHAPRRN